MALSTLAKQLFVESKSECKKNLTGIQMDVLRQDYKKALLLTNLFSTSLDPPE